MIKLKKNTNLNGNVSEVKDAKKSHKFWVMYFRHGYVLRPGGRGSFFESVTFLIFDGVDQKLAMKDDYEWYLHLMLKCWFKDFFQ